MLCLAIGLNELTFDIDVNFVVIDAALAHNPPLQQMLPSNYNGYIFAL
jgi:hypothetical protein